LILRCYQLLEIPTRDDQEEAIKYIIDQRQCVKNASNAVQDMLGGPPSSVGMNRSQTALSCCILRAMVVSVKEKAGDSQV